MRKYKENWLKKKVCTFCCYLIGYFFISEANKSLTLQYQPKCYYNCKCDQMCINQRQYNVRCQFSMRALSSSSCGTYRRPSMKINMQLTTALFSNLKWDRSLLQLLLVHSGKSLAYVDLIMAHKIWSTIFY